MIAGDLQTPRRSPTRPSTPPSAPRCWSTSTTTRPRCGELARVLRPGGLLLVTVPANPYRYDWTDRWAGHRRRYTVRGAARADRGGRLRRRRGRRAGASRSPASTTARCTGAPCAGASRRAAGAPRAARRRAWPRAPCARRSRSTRPSSAAAPATTACWPPRGGVPNPAEAAAAAPARASPWRRRGGLIAGLLVLGFLGWALIDGWSAVAEYDWDVEPGLLALGCVVLLVFYLASGLGYVAASSTASTPAARRARVMLVDLGPVPARALRARERADGARAAWCSATSGACPGAPRSRRRSTSSCSPSGVGGGGRGRVRRPLRAAAGAARVWLLALRAARARPAAPARSSGPRPAWVLRLAKREPLPRLIPPVLLAAGRLVRPHRRPPRPGHLAAGALGGRRRGGRPGLRRPGVPALVRRLDARLHLPVGPRRARGGLRHRARAEPARQRRGGPLGGHARDADDWSSSSSSRSSCWPVATGELGPAGPPAAPRALVDAPPRAAARVAVWAMMAVYAGRLLLPRPSPASAPSGPAASTSGTWCRRSGAPPTGARSRPPTSTASSSSRLGAHVDPILALFTPLAWTGPPARGAPGGPGA